MSLTVNSLSAVPDFRTADLNGSSPLPGQRTIWSLLAPEPANYYEDGQTGSKCPVTFQIPNAATATYTINIEFDGVFTFPTTWTDHYVVTATLNGNKILTSSQGIIPPPSPSGPVPTPIKLSGFTMNAPFSAFVCPVPFRWAGDFVWQISNVETPTNSASSSPVVTRLELCWSAASASTGPLFVTSELLKTRVNFPNASWPVGLIRQFWPQPTEFSGIANFDSSTVYGPWYANRTMNAIWGWGTPHSSGKPQYDATTGGSHYNVGPYGGSFKLKEWLMGGALCNCYDLSSISQLACAVILDVNGNERLFSQWVFQEPNGYILPGTLYGRDDKPNCNNPGFLTRAPPLDAFIDPKLDPNKALRYPFATHVWVEVSYDGETTRQVLDATHGINGQPENGTNDRASYAAAHIDPYWKSDSKYASKFGNLNNKGVTNPSGSCYQTPEYHLSSTPPERIDRIGVDDTRGAITTTTVALQQLPDGLRTSIMATLELGTRDTAITQAFHNACLRPEALSPLITDVIDGLTLSRTSVTLTGEMSEIHIRFGDDAQNEPLMLTIQVYDNYEGPATALTNHLLGYQFPLSEVLSPTQTPLGRVSLRTLNSIVWIRGNLFVTLRHHVAEVSDEASARLHTAATRIDSYLEAGAVQPPLHFQPDIRLGGEPIEKVKAGERFALCLASNERNFEETYAESSDETVIASEGRGWNNDGVFKLMALNPGQAMVKLCLAHKQNLHPRSRLVRIEVVD